MRTLDKKHPSAPKPNPSTKEVTMPAKKKTRPVLTLPAGTTTSSPVTASDPSTSTPPPTVSTTAATPAAPTVVDSPPTSVMPTPPAGFVEVNLDEFRGFRPKATQVAVAPLVSAELSSATDYEEQFGPTAPDATDCANAVDLAVRWRTVRTAIEAFSVYVRTQDCLAWAGAVTLLRQLEPLFAAAVTHDPTVAAAHPGLARFFAAPKVIAKSAVATKKKAAKAKAETTATPAAATPTVTAGRVVTVSG